MRKFKIGQTWAYVDNDVGGQMDALLRDGFRLGMVGRSPGLYPILRKTVQDADPYRLRDGFRVSAHKTGQVIVYILVHHIALSPIDGMDVDHVNGIRTDSRRTNLRQATKGQSSANKGLASNNSSGFKGVTWTKSKRCWRARLQDGHKSISIGYYASAKEAARAYDDAARKRFGGFACLNFPGKGERGCRENSHGRNKTGDD